MQDLLETMARLRGPDGCPWDREQTHQSLARHLLEESAELIDTIERGDIEHMREELGDVLLQVVFHARMAEEAGHFDFAAVASEINAKLVRRHPHVFGDLDLENAAEVLVEWEKIKAREKSEAKPDHEPGPWDDLPRTLPTLLLIDKFWKRVDQRADQLPDTFPAKVAVERQKATPLPECQSEEDFARAVVFLGEQARKKGWDPEGAVRRYLEGMKNKG